MDRCCTVLFVVMLVSPGSMYDPTYSSAPAPAPARALPGSTLTVAGRGQQQAAAGGQGPLPQQQVGVLYMTTIQLKYGQFGL